MVRTVKLTTIPCMRQELRFHRSKRHRETNEQAPTHHKKNRKKQETDMEMRETVRRRGMMRHERTPDFIMLRGSISSLERSFCNHRFVVDSGTPCASVIFLLPRSWTVCFVGEEFLCGAHQNARKMQHMCFDTHEAVVHGFGVVSQCCASV